MQDNSKTDFLPGIQFGLIALSSLLLNNSLLAADQKKPNLLFIMTDQQRFDALSIASHTRLHHKDFNYRPIFDQNYRG